MLDSRASPILELVILFVDAAIFVVYDLSIGWFL